MLSIFNHAYPPPEPGTRGILVSIFFGVFIGFFLIFFEPFGLDRADYAYKTATLSVFGFISAFVSLIFINIIPLLFKSIFSYKNWMVKHQILFYFIALFFIATLNGLYLNYLNQLDFSWISYWTIIKQTFILGGMPICFIVLLDYNRRMHLNLNEAKALVINQNEKLNTPQENQIEIFTGINKQLFTINTNSFLYASAQGNYIYVFEQESYKVSKTLHRVSLTHFEEQLNDKNLVRCHRSFVINLMKVKHVTGNAQGLKLEVENIDELVPVSRKYLPIVKKHFARS